MPSAWSLQKLGPGTGGLVGGVVAVGVGLGVVVSEGSGVVGGAVGITPKRGGTEKRGRHQYA